MDSSAIYFYSKANTFFELSNFEFSPFEIDGVTYATVEHYFQSVKFLEDPDYADRVRKAETPASAKALGRSRKHKLREDWDEFRIEAMKTALVAKFTQNKKLGDLLASTGDRMLVENAPRDYFWGCGAKKTGKNMLGTLLMHVRSEYFTIE